MFVFFPEFLKVIPGQRPRSTPRLASGLCSHEGRDELENLFELYGVLAPGYERALAEALERINLCVALHEARAGGVKIYFARFAPSESEAPAGDQVETDQAATIPASSN